MAKEKEKMEGKFYEGNRKAGVGLFLILLGLFFLARELGIIPKNLPWWPIVLIFAGLFLLFKGILK
jgi:hypothetical protein